jgi:hypothetical protein
VEANVRWVRGEGDPLEARWYSCFRVGEDLDTGAPCSAGRLVYLGRSEVER